MAKGSSVVKLSDLIERARSGSGERAIPGRGDEVLRNREKEYSPPADITDRDVQLRLLEQLREVPIMTRVCRRLGIDYRSLLALRKADPDFSLEVEDARAEGYDRLEEHAFNEALANGFRGHKLLEFLLKGRKRHVYGDRLDVSGSTRHEVVINLIPPGEAAALAPGRPGGDRGRRADIVDAESVEVDRG